MSSKISCECMACKIEICPHYVVPCSFHDVYRTHRRHSNKACSAPDVRPVSKEDSRHRSEAEKNSLSMNMFAWPASPHPAQNIPCTGLSSQYPNTFCINVPSDQSWWYRINTTTPDVLDLPPDDHVWGRRMCSSWPLYLRSQRHIADMSGRYYMACKSH